ncbi:5'-nucleotidase C-terminal domain-containing protein [Arcanobacterium hippocoleae]
MEAARKNSSRPMLKLGLSANVKYTFDPAKKMGERITSILIDGKPINPDKLYSVGSVTFLLAGGDSFDILKDPSIAKTLTTISEGLDREWLQKYLTNNPTVQPRTAVSSVGVTLDSNIDGTKVNANVHLRGLSFSQDGEAKTQKVTVKLADAAVSADVNNTLEDANASKENAIVTADGVGYLDKPVAIHANAKCENGAKSAFLPLTVLNEKGAELVSAAAGLGVTVPCANTSDPAAAGKTPAVSGADQKAGPVNTAKTAAAPATPLLAKTGADAAGFAGFAAIALVIGMVSLAATRRYKMENASA